MWIKLDDGFATHPKILAAGPIALAVQIRALCYSGRYLTDGFIPDGVASSLFTGMERIGLEVAGVREADGKQLVGMGMDADEIDWAAHMVEHGLWEMVQGGYLIHDYLDYNLSKKQVQKWRKKLSTAGRKGMKARWNQSDTSITHVITKDITHHITSRTGLGQDKDRSLEEENYSLSSHEKERKSEPVDHSPKIAGAQTVSKQIPQKGDIGLQKIGAMDAARKWFPPIP